MDRTLSNGSLSNRPLSTITPVIETERTSLLMLTSVDAELIRDYYQQNQSHLALWEPLRSEEFYTIAYWQHQLTENLKQYEDGSALKLVALNKSQTEIIAVCNFSNIVMGIFQACNLGYSVAKRYEGRGYMYEVLQAAINYAFDSMGLHRIMANYIITNNRSAAVLDKLGFEQEGIAKSYLKIAGRWQDHVLTSKINPNVHP
ncbi:GNAT family N-acetyltransferase [Shewanella sp. KX20019]|uniref:GNAT family N-acetyltransferase n=1 Tax=Shewanella sp. KX20019 TaxID=2803864 RepID=UPI001926EC8E|nr:GNAT family N-acetyltransferase [Shewanella sp. KX20019]QQX81063.1 GNAT family N-acetyltransferase [Shewanella sp. KX20019]